MPCNELFELKLVVEIRHTVPCRAIRGSGISVNSASLLGTRDAAGRAVIFILMPLPRKVLRASYFIQLWFAPFCTVYTKWLGRGHGHERHGSRWYPRRCAPCWGTSGGIASLTLMIIDSDCDAVRRAGGITSLSLIIITCLTRITSLTRNFLNSCE